MQTATEEQAKKLLSYDKDKAEQTVEQQKELVPLMQEVIDAYQPFNFERKINSIETLRELAHDFENFIYRERMKAIPDDIGGVPIDRDVFLKTVAKEPQGLAELKQKALALMQHHFEPQFFLINKNGKAFFDEKKVEEIHERYKSYARGKQIELIEMAEQLAELANKFHKHRIDNPMALLAYHRGGTYEGDKANFYIRDQRFCLQYEA